MNVDSHNACESLTNEPLRILFWNVNGLTQDKLHDDILGKLFKEYDIILLSETWANELGYFGLSGFNYLNYPRKYSHPNCKRNSGGLGIFIKTSLANGISAWCHTDDVVAWVILDKSVFGFKNNLYLCCVYIFPENSTYLKHNEYDILFNDMAKIPSDCEILLCGDCNARTNVAADHDRSVCGSDGDFEILIPNRISESCQTISAMHEMGKLTRYSMDTAPINKHGTKLPEICKATDLLNFNGRLSPDLGVGEFTRDDTTGRSVVNYAIGSPVIFNHVNYFKVLDEFPESDHRPISLFLSMNCKHSDRNTLTEEPEWQFTQRYVWCRDNLDRISHMISDETSGSFYDALCNSISNLVDTNTVVENFDFYISQACERAFNRVRCTRKNKKRTCMVWPRVQVKMVNCD